MEYIFAGCSIEASSSKVKSYSPSNIIKIPYNYRKLIILIIYLIKILLYLYYFKMAKSKNHSNHNQGHKNHRNGIKRPVANVYESLKCVKFINY